MDDENLEQDGKQELGDVLFSWKRRFDNFWYHYKVPFIFGVLILGFLIFCIAQCSFRTKGDANMGYIGGQNISSEHYENIRNALKDMLGEDLNGDGKVHVEFTGFFYMTSVQVENARARGNPVDVLSLNTVWTQINLELEDGNIILYFIDPEVYKELSNIKGTFMPLEDSLGYIPDDAYDSFTLRLGNLQCWDYYEGLNDLPSNTLIAVRDLKVSEEDNKQIKEKYERNLIMLKRLVDFKYLKDDID